MSFAALIFFLSGSDFCVTQKLLDFPASRKMVANTVSVTPLNGSNYPTWKVQCQMALMKYESSAREIHRRDVKNIPNITIT